MSFNVSMRVMTSFTTPCSWLPGASRRPITCMAPRIPASGLRTSCATIAAILPSCTSAVCARSAASDRLRSVMS